MEPKMINLKVLSTVAALALLLPMAAPVESQAAGRGGFGGGGGARMGGGGGMHMGGGGGAFRGAAIGGGGARFAASPGFARPSMGVAPAARFSGAAVGSRYAGNWNGGNGGNWNGGWRHRGHGGYWPGVVAGAVVGGALANSYAYYGDPYYYGNNGYYDDGYYDDSTVAVAPGGGDDAGYCAQRYRSYDPASGTYLGYDGQRHPCP
jgi:hypothetical protein